MNRLMRFYNAAQSALRPDSVGAPLPELGKCGRHTKHRGGPHSIIGESKQHAKICLAKTDSVREDGLENRVQLTG